MDLNMPRDKETGKTKGFGFLMYEDQRSTVLAVDNLNGAKVLEKILRVDHVKNYKQPKTRNEDGEWIEPEEQSLNARPEMIINDDARSDSSTSSGPTIDPEDPMYEYLVAKRKEEKALKKVTKIKSKSRHKNETPAERQARKARKKEKKERRTWKGKSEGMKGVEALLNSLGGRDLGRPPSSSPSRTRRRSPSRSLSPMRDRHRRQPLSRSQSCTPPGPGNGGSPRRPSYRYSDDKRSPYGQGARSRRSAEYD